MSNQKIVIDGLEYNVGKECSFQWSDGDYMANYTYYECEYSAWPFHKILANYGEYWGVGENLRAASAALEAVMFAAHRKAFIGVVSGKKEIVDKQK